MASFKDIFGQGAMQAAAGQQVTQTQHCLPSGETVTVSSTGDGNNHVYTQSGSTFTFDDATWQQVVSGAISMETITAEEKQELEDLEKEKQSWFKQQRLKGFQRLPAHIRQEIVDEAYIKDFINEMSEIDENQFEGQSRINELKSKEQIQMLLSTFGHQLNVSGNQWYSPHTFAGTSDQPIDQMVFKYGKIINEFTTQELAEAHSAATIEENLED